MTIMKIVTFSDKDQIEGYEQITKFLQGKQCFTWSKWLVVLGKGEFMTFFS